MLTNKKILYLSVALFTFAVSLRQINDFDYWTHLFIGRELISGVQGPGDIASLLQRTFSGLHSERPFQLFLYLLYAAGGHVLVSVFVAALASAVFLPFLALVRDDISRSHALALFLVMAAVSTAALFRFVPRPELAGYFLYSSVFLAVARWMSRPDTARLIPAILLFSVWMTIHVSWTLGLFFIFLHVLLAAPRGFLKNTFFRKERYVLVPLLSAAVLFAVFKASGFVWFVLSNLDSATGILSGVTEMRPVWEFPDVLMQYLAVTGLVFACVLSGNGNRIKKTFFLAVSFLVGLFVVRNMAFVLLAMLPLAVESLSDSQAGAVMKKSNPRTYLLTGSAALVAVFFFFRVLAANDPPAGVGIDWSLVPRDAAAHVQEAGLPGPVFNNWDCGGYLLWAWNEEPPPFLDGRLGSRQKMQEHDNVVDGIDPAGTIGKYGFKTVLLQPLYHNSGRIAPAVHYFLSDNSWKLVRASDALVFTTQPGSGPVLDQPAAWQAIFDQAREREGRGSQAAHLLYTQGLALFQMGQWDRGREVLVRAVRAHPELKSQYLEK